MIYKNCACVRVWAQFSLRWFLAATLGGLSLGVGCGGGPTVFEVTGKVTYRGEAVDSGTINFRSAEGKLFGGGLQTGGLYEFQMPQGEYSVRIDAPAPLPIGWKEGDPLPVRARRLAPMKYASFRSSGLTAPVGPQDDDPLTINFDLK